VFARVQHRFDRKTIALRHPRKEAIAVNSPRDLERSAWRRDRPPSLFAIDDHVYGDVFALNKRRVESDSKRKRI
jgi:hypothetical protein